LSLDKLIQEFIHGWWVLELLNVRRERLRKIIQNRDTFKQNIVKKKHSKRQENIMAKKGNQVSIIHLMGIALVIFIVVLFKMGGSDKEQPAETTHTVETPHTKTKVAEAKQPQEIQQEPTPLLVSEEITQVPEEDPEPDWKARAKKLYNENLELFPGGTVVGSVITLKLKGGGTQKGTFGGLNGNAVILKIGSATIELQNIDLEAETRIKLFKNDYAKYYALKTVKQEQEAWKQGQLAKEQEQQRILDATAQAEKAEDLKERLKENFSPWDGSHYKLIQITKENMLDPKSFKHKQTVLYRDKQGRLFIAMEYRGKNAFGATIINEIGAYIDEQGNITELITE